MRNYTEILNNLTSWLTADFYKLHTKIISKFGEPTVYKERKYIYYENNPDFPMIVAHLDTINQARNKPDPIIEDIVTIESTSISGDLDYLVSLKPSSKEFLECLGADDRVGVSIIDMIRSDNYEWKENFNILFTYDEEVGCLGSKDFIIDYPDLKPKFIIQLDRRGDDVVFYNTTNKNFQSHISKIMNKPISTGSTSDVRVLSNKYEVNGVNISVGYNKEHTTDESVNLFIMKKTLNNLNKFIFNKGLVERVGSFDYEKPTPYVYKPRSTYGYQYADGWNYSTTTTTTAPTVKPKPKAKKIKNSLILPDIDVYKKANNIAKLNYNEAFEKTSGFFSYIWGLCGSNIVKGFPYTKVVTTTDNKFIINFGKTSLELIYKNEYDEVNKQNNFKIDGSVHNDTPTKLGDDWTELYDELEETISNSLPVCYKIFKDINLSLSFIKDTLIKELKYIYESDEYAEKKVNKKEETWLN